MIGNVNKELLPIKAHYFLFNAATGPIVPFLPTIAKQLGFSGFLVGTIYMILPISGLLAKPLFGALADKFRIHKLLFLIFQVVVAISLFSIYFIPEIRRENVALICNGDASLEICSENGFSPELVHKMTADTVHLNVSCQMSCKGSQEIYTEMCLYWNATQFCESANSTSILDTETFDFTLTFDVYHDAYINKCAYIRIFSAKFLDDEVQNKHKPACKHYARTLCTATCHDNPTFDEVFHEADVPQNITQNATYQFHSFLWATIISWIGMAVVVTMADAICFDLLGNDRRKEYGKQKMWSSIGFGIFGTSAGYLVDLFSEGKFQKNYSCIFYIALVIMIFDVLTSTTLRKKNAEQSEAQEPSILWELLTIFKDGNVLAFGWWCIGAGMCTSVVWNFLFWYTEDLATSSQITRLKTLQGLLTGVQCFLGELPFNFISGDVLRKLGHVNVMSLVLLMYAIRFMAYSTVSNPWWFLIIEILHGPSLGLCWPTMVSYGDKVTPPGTKGTVQGFTGAIFEGIGVSSGSLICGWLMDSYGGVTTLRVFSMGALLWLTLFWLVQLLVRKLKMSPAHMGHNHLASYANPDDAILMTMSRELQTY
ncbi:major facilitator superfamily domain-containing protein 6 [Ceratina calcarata]|uniref:Major facilitator superfamily domain-containing protein 6 n=1 Tax=Ceratina calcarata TaxID=156304 RepID=A0AAJ7RW82_9HYME|nr:major facilitator superfamily domain-containing protein 6 [Ceratina calcarata]XP_026666859.1 major facilitator superfamily domain-containing protein 6 [Ceratina calcarata]XP_026666867.1 major facilitator superfamily domain-containing protein 6 [Ceratina calcarata]XP_026666870.1 major facilitator superfamily domain-containing protein 6 [Ceratina calcarata]